MEKEIIDHLKNSTFATSNVALYMYRNKEGKDKEEFEKMLDNLVRENKIKCQESNKIATLATTEEWKIKYYSVPDHMRDD